MRNYYKNPLKIREYPIFEDIYHYYIERNFTKTQCMTIFNVSRNKLEAILTYYKLVKTKEMKRIAYENYNLLKYGVKNVALLKSSQEKMKKTMLERYGVENIGKRKETVEKRKKTCLNKYGVDNPAKVERFQEKARETNISKYGVNYVTQNKIIRQKQLNTMQERYGVLYPYQNKSCVEKAKQTNLEKYGVDNAMKSSTFKSKLSEQIQNRYGVDNIMKLDEFKKKVRNTQKKNFSFGKSKEEDYIYQCLVQKYPKTKRQYYSDVYPFACDFYIPEIDLYMEYQGYGCHGKAPYNPKNIKHQRKLETWKRKAQEVNYKCKLKEQYSAWIKIWTVKDPEKRKVAKKNNLNWIEFFSLKEFEEWWNKHNETKT